MVKCPALFVLALAIAPALAQAPSASPSSAPAESASIASAERLIAKGRLDDALKQLDSLALQSPEPAGAERLRGMAYYQQNKLPPALEAFHKAAGQDANDREAMQMEGVTLFRLGRPAEAIPLLEKAHVAVPGANVDANYVLGLCYMDARRFDDARSAFASQYGFPPDSASAYLLAGRMLLRREYLPVSETFTRKALELNPNLPLAHLLLGEIDLARSQLAQAIAELEKERDLNPLYGEVYDRLGDAYIRQGDYDKAQAALDRAVLLIPNATGPFILLGKVMLKQQSPAVAQMYLERALKMDPGNYMAHTLLGQAYRDTGQTEQASHEFQVAEQIQAANAPKLENPR